MNTFNYRPTYPAKLSRKPGFNSVSYGDGYSQDAPKGINNNPENWDLQFNAVDPVIGQGIDDFLFAQNGQPFLWVNNRGVTKAYKCTTWEYSIDDNDVGAVTATFQEYFGTTV